MIQKYDHSFEEPYYLPRVPEPVPVVKRVIRVNNAGKYCTARIYAGQMAILRNNPKMNILNKMGEQKIYHCKYFEEIIPFRRASPHSWFPSGMWQAIL